MPRLLEIASAAEVDIIDITSRVNEAIAGSGDGVCVAFMKHTTAALTLASLEENAARDLARVLPMLVPQIDWQHLPPEHNTAHLISAILGANVSMPVKDGKLDLGTYQKLVLIEMHGPGTRTVELHFVATK